MLKLSNVQGVSLIFQGGKIWFSERFPGENFVWKNFGGEFPGKNFQRKLSRKISRENFQRKMVRKKFPAKKKILEKISRENFQVKIFRENSQGKFLRIYF